MNTLLALSSLGLAASAAWPLAGTYPVKIWGYAQLFQKSDLILIGRATSAREATERETLDADDRERAKEYLRMVSTFSVIDVVKGEFKAKTLDLVHLWHSRESWEVTNGPRLARFHVGERETRGEGWTDRRVVTYLMFLKKAKDGRYDPVTGHFHEVGQSFLELHRLNPYELPLKGQPALK